MQRKYTPRAYLGGVTFRRTLALLAVAALCALPLFTQSARHAKALQTPVPPREVIGFYTDYESGIENKSSLQTLMEKAEHLTTIIGFWYLIDENDPSRVVRVGRGDDWDLEMIVAIAKKRGVKVQALFHNLSYAGGIKQGREVVHRLLSSDEMQAKLIDNLVGLVKRFGFDGLNMDIESVYPQDRHRLTAFTERLAKRLHEIGAVLSIDVPAKFEDSPYHGWSGAFDYTRLGKVVDQFIVMSYDEHGYASDPGPIASLGWVRRVMKYAASQVPSHKLYMGIPGYGFVWAENAENPMYMSHAGIVNLAKQVGASVGWDKRAEVPYFEYTRDGVKHRVWFEDARSTELKLALLEELDLRGIALWRMGLEDERFWDLVKKDPSASANTKAEADSPQL